VRSHRRSFHLQMAMTGISNSSIRRHHDFQSACHASSLPTMCCSGHECGAHGRATLARIVVSSCASSVCACRHSALRQLLPSGLVPQGFERFLPGTIIEGSTADSVNSATADTAAGSPAVTDRLLEGDVGQGVAGSTDGSDANGRDMHGSAAATNPLGAGVCLFTLQTNCQVSSAECCLTCAMPIFCPRPLALQCSMCAMSLLQRWF
jgi:hypothetical protein